MVIYYHCSGLGAGIVPRSMFTHGIRPTILELDPLVYQYAREYFGLDRLTLPVSGNGSAHDGEVYIGDARPWITKRANETSTDKGPKGRKDKFDYIIHDVFSGGSVPAHLFTLEFWNDVRRIMRDDGILAVVRPIPPLPMPNNSLVSDNDRTLPEKSDPPPPAQSSTPSSPYSNPPAEHVAPTTTPTNPNSHHPKTQTHTKHSSTWSSSVPLSRLFPPADHTTPTSKIVR